MHIFVDESGNFIRQLGSPADVSCMAALVVPDAELEGALEAFRSLKDKWGVGSSEIKGSSINESQAAQLVDTLRNYDVILIPVVMDLGLHAPNDVESHRPGALPPYEISSMLLLSAAALRRRRSIPRS